MQSLLSPAFRIATATSSTSPGLLAGGPPHHRRISRRLSFQSHQILSSSPLNCLSLLSNDAVDHRRSKLSIVSMATTSPVDDSEKVKLAQVAKRLESTARHFKRLGNLGFWGQLVCTIVSAVIISFAVVITGSVSSPVTFYATTGGIVAAFISVFWSFGYIRLSETLKRTANDPSKAPSRAYVVNGLKNGIVVNLLGMGAAILGMLATVGLLVAKSLTYSANPYQGLSAAAGHRPVLALDVFLVQASANTILSHFLGLVFSLELLRSVTLPPSDTIPVPRVT